jgi:acetoin utilization protein AcuB
MKSDPITINPDTSFYEAENLIRSKGIRHLPVVNKEKHLVGLVTDRDIREAGPSDASTLSIQEMHYLLGKLQVKGLMAPLKKLITVGPETIVERAAQLMYEHKIGCLPVIEGKQLVGIITETDLLELFVDIVGLNVEGTRITIALEDEPGQMFGFLLIRLRTQDVDPILSDLREQNYDVLSTVPWPSTQ